MKSKTSPSSLVSPMPALSPAHASSTSVPNERIDGDIRVAPGLGVRLRRFGTVFFRLARREPLFLIGTLVIAMFALVAVFAPVVAPYDPAATNASLGLGAPSRSHLMGTDQLGRDVFSRVVYGTRISISVGVLAVSLSMILGATLGLLCGYFRGLIDSIVMRLIDVMLAFPTLVAALVIAAVLGPGMRSVIIAIGTAGIPTIARVTRGAVIRVSVEDYILAAKSAGCRPRRIILRHILPNVVSPIMVIGTLYVGLAVLAASALSFLGVGIQPPSAEWGSMLNQGRAVFIRGWWLSVFPGLMIVIFVLAVNFIGEVLNDHFDVRLRSREGVPTRSV